MQYKLHKEPMYAIESMSILKHVVTGTSIRRDMEESIEKRGISAKETIEGAYRQSIAIEDYIKENVILDLPGFEENGNEIAKFLFTQWDDAEDAPIAAIFTHELAKTSGLDNKAAVILSLINNIWFCDDPDIPPPEISDAEFFAIIDKADIPLEYKYGAIKLLTNYQQYSDYTHAIFAHMKELLKQKLPEFIGGFVAFSDYLEKELAAHNSAFFLDKIGITINDDQMYHIYPRIYMEAAISLWLTGYNEPLLLVGKHVFTILDMVENDTSRREDAIAFIKCLADDTKRTILQLLKDGPMYGSQLAEKLNCTSANISHHMTALLKLGVIYVEKENNRVYFHLKNEAICQHLEDAKGMFM